MFGTRDGVVSHGLPTAVASPDLNGAVSILGPSVSVGRLRRGATEPKSEEGTGASPDPSRTGLLISLTPVPAATARVVGFPVLTRGQVTTVQMGHAWNSEA
jgi:hypothetical protein